MKYILVENGLITNIIIADEAFGAQIGALPYYDGASIGQPYAPPYEPTTEERLAAVESAMLSMMGVNPSV